MSKRVALILASAVLIAALIVAAATSTGAGVNTPVAVYPSDGSQAASPKTQISFRGHPLSQLTGISVTGSETGHHSGRLAAHSDGMGASFLPPSRSSPARP